MSGLSLTEKKNLIEKFNSAGNEHNIDEAVSYLQSDGRLILNGEIIAEGIDQIRECFKHCMSKDDYFSQIIEYFPSNNDDDQLKVYSKTNEEKQYEEIYVFSKDHPKQFSQISARLIA